MSIEEILRSEFEDIKKEMSEKHIALGMKASGNWLESLAVYATDTSVRLEGERYTEQLVSGRKPGSFPPIDAIKQWILDKGIMNEIEGDITVSSLAFLIARKIKREGTEYFKQGGTDLVDAIITPQRIQKIIDKIGVQLTNSFSSQLVNLLKTAA